MEQVSGVHVLQTLEDLIHDVLLMNVFEDVGSDDGVEICVHEIEHQVDVAVIFGADDVLQANDVLVAGQLLQEDDLSEGALRISCVLESVKVFLKCNDLLRTLVNRLPHNTVGALS
jgi:hypothetical protein